MRHPQQPVAAKTQHLEGQVSTSCKVGWSDYCDSSAAVVDARKVELASDAVWEDLSLHDPVTAAAALLEN